MRLVPFAVLACAMIAGPALAQDRPAADPVAASALFHDGREAVKRGDYVTGCEKLGASYRLDPAAGTLLNLADCQQQLGKLATAWQLFHRATEQLAANDERAAIAKQRVEELASRLPKLVVTLAPRSPRGTTVQRDGAELVAGSLGVALPVDPGEHTVVVAAPGHADRRFTVTVAEGKTERLEVAAGPVVATPAPQRQPVPAAPAGMSLARKAAIPVAALGVVGIGVAIGTGLALPGYQATVDAHCGADFACDHTGAVAAQNGNTFATVNTVAWVVGGTAIGAGALLFVFGGDKSAKVGLRIDPAGASLRGAF